MLKDKAPDLLARIVPRYFERDGFCFAIVPGTADHRGQLVFYYQNRYERACEGTIWMAPTKVAFKDVSDLPEFKVQVVCGGGEFGKRHCECGLPLRFRGESILWDVRAQTQYPNGRGKLLRMRDGLRVGGENQAGTFLALLLFVGAWYYKKPARIKIKFPDEMFSVEYTSDWKQETLWKPGDRDPVLSSSERTSLRIPISFKRYPLAIAMIAGALTGAGFDREWGTCYFGGFVTILLAWCLFYLIKHPERAGFLGSTRTFWLLGVPLAWLVGVAFVPCTKLPNHHFLNKISLQEPAIPGTNTYHTNGVLFSYYSDWTVAEKPADPTTVNLGVNGSRITRIIQSHVPLVKITGPDNTSVDLALFPPSDDETLEAYALRVKSAIEGELRGHTDDKRVTMEQVVSTIHGLKQGGYKLHFTIQMPDGSFLPSSQYFFMLRNRKHKIMIITHGPENHLDNPPIKLILDSILLEEKRNPPGLIDYSRVNFDKLEESLSVGCSTAQKSSGEDLSVAKAWNHTLTEFIAARQEMLKAADVFETSDILNVHSIINNLNPRAYDDQFVERRGIANAYYSALGDWRNKLNTLHNCYQKELHQFGVGEGRCLSELERMTEETSDGINRLQAASAADQEVAHRYNNAVGAMAVYLANKNSKDFERELAELDALKLKAERLHGEYQLRGAQPRPVAAPVEDGRTTPPAGDEINPGKGSAQRQESLAGNQKGAEPAVPAGRKVSMIIYKPIGAVAVIGNKTVMTGDAVQEFTIVAIGTNSVTVKSPAGVKKELRLGDVLN